MESIITVIANLTDVNDHTGAVIELAKALENTKSVEILDSIRKLHGLYGYMPSQLIELRSRECEDLLKQARTAFGDKVADQIQASF